MTYLKDFDPLKVGEILETAIAGLPLMVNVGRLANQVIEAQRKLTAVSQSRKLKKAEAALVARQVQHFQNEKRIRDIAQGLETVTFQAQEVNPSLGSLNQLGRSVAAQAPLIHPACVTMLFMPDYIRLDWVLRLNETQRLIDHLENPRK